MNFLKKGPELKLPELKVPDFLVDIYYDLQERHLLPLAAILIVAIVAVPFALSESSESEGPETAVAGAGAVTSTATTTGSHRLVAKSAPGLRDYRHRLDGLHSKDPFEQQFAQAAESSAAATESSGGEPAGGSTEAPSTTAPSGSETTAPQPTPGPGDLVYYSYAIDVRVSAGGSATGPSTEPTVRKNLPELTMLPSRETPAVIYMGSTKDGKKALMLISSDVEATFGDAKCVLGSQTCELLALEPGVPEIFVYGGAGRTYKIELLKIHLVKTDKLNRAPLGKPPKRGASH
jgi:hypothetical protein